MINLHRDITSKTTFQIIDIGWVRIFLSTEQLWILPLKKIVFWILISGALQDAISDIEERLTNIKSICEFLIGNESLKQIMSGEKHFVSFSIFLSVSVSVSDLTNIKSICEFLSLF